MSEIKNLKSIAEIYKSDKIEHGYIQKYESYFEKIRDEKLKILEIGIADGKSLLTWSDYFKNSIIIGIDIHKINIFEKNLDRNNIEVHRGSQSDQSFIEEIISKYTEFDIIIDDGSHLSKDVKKCLPFASIPVLLNTLVLPVSLFVTVRVCCSFV